MGEMLEDAKTYLRMVWRHRWIALTAAYVVCLVGWIGVAIIPNEYESKAMLYLEKTSLLKPVLKETADQISATDEMAALMRHALLVRPNLERLARAAGIDKKTVTLYELDLAIDKIKGSIEINPIANQQGVYGIAYQHTDPRVAYSVVRTTVDIFKETPSNNADTAQRFIRKQLKEYEIKLQKAEQRLKEFKEKNMGFMLGDGRSYYGRLESARNLYRSAVLDLNEAEDSASSIRAQLNNAKTASGNALEAGGVQNPVFAQVKAQQTKLAELQLKFTDKHPDVIAAKRLLADMIAKTSGEARPVSTGERKLNSLDYDPAYQGLKLQLSKAEANVAASRQRVAEYKRRVDTLEQKVETIPQVETELASLNRDYAVQQDKYQRLAEGREIAALSDKAGSGKVTVVEQPRLPRTPIGPNRFVFSAAVFAIAVASGVALALALALSNPVIYMRRGLEKLIDIPVLGTVSYNGGTGRLKPHKPFVDPSFIFGVSMLLIIYVTLNAMYFLKVDVLMKVAGPGIVG